MNTLKISRADALKVLAGISVPSFISVVYQTEYIKGKKRLNKFCPYGQVKKTEKSVFLIGGDRQKAVEKAAKKAGVPVPEPEKRAWGVHVTKTWITHKYENYIQFRRLKNSKRKVHYFADGKTEIKYSDISAYFYAEKEKPLVLTNDINIKNIRKFTYRGVLYVIFDAPIKRGVLWHINGATFIVEPLPNDPTIKQPAKQVVQSE